MKQDASRRLLVVEDELMVAMSLEMLLRQVGFEVVGPIGWLAEAREIAATAEVDAGLLDINLHGEAVYPVADTLAARGIPFIFLSGYARQSLPPRYSNGHILSKPCRPEDLLAAIETLIRRADGKPTE